MYVLFGLRGFVLTNERGCYSRRYKRKRVRFCAHDKWILNWIKLIVERGFFGV